MTDKVDELFPSGDAERRAQRFARWSKERHAGDDVLGIPEPDALIEDWLSFDSTNVIYGATGTYKTFISLDMALSIGCDVDWQGYQVTRTGVVYVLTEGRGFISKRIAAWKEHRGVGHLPDDFVLITAPVALLQEGCAEDFAAFVMEASAHPPGLIVFDTLSRVLGSSGVDEQGNMTMQAAVDASDAVNVHLENVRDGRRAATLWNAHTGWTSDHVRGGSAFQSGVSTAIHVEADEKAGTITLHNPKQRDSIKEVDLHLVPLPVGATRSIVLVADDRVFARRRGLTSNQKAKLRLLCDAGSFTFTGWANAAEYKGNSFGRVANVMVEGGFATFSAATGLFAATNAGLGECGLPLPASEATT